MAVISDYFEETSEAPPAKPVAKSSPSGPFDDIFTSLLREQNNQPFELVRTMFDFLKRKTELFTESGAEAHVTEIVSSVKRQRVDGSGEHTFPTNNPQTGPMSLVSYATSKGHKEAQKPAIEDSAVPWKEEKGADITEKALDSADEEGNKAVAKGLKPNAGNGADLDKYSWTQSLAEVTVHIAVADGTKSREVVCEIKKTHLKVGLKGQAPVIEGQLDNTVMADECFWSLEDRNLISVHLTKRDPFEWWTCAIKGDPEIDTKCVEAEHGNTSKFDAEERQAVERMMYDRRQKAMGLPTSDDQEKYYVLQKFMAEHPDMDFSMTSLG